MDVEARGQLPFSTVILLHDEDPADDMLCLWVASAITMMVVPTPDRRFALEQARRPEVRLVLVGGRLVRSVLNVHKALRGVHPVRLPGGEPAISCFGSGAVETGMLLAELAFRGFGWPPSGPAHYY